METPRWARPQGPQGLLCAPKNRSAAPVTIMIRSRSLSHSQIFSIFQITPYVRYQDHTIDHNNDPISFTNIHDVLLMVSPTIGYQTCVAYHEGSHRRIQLEHHAFLVRYRANTPYATRGTHTVGIIDSLYIPHLSMCSRLIMIIILWCICQRITR